MSKLFSMLVVLALALGLVASPAATHPAEAHVVVGKTTVSKPVKLSGTVIRGYAKVTLPTRAQDPKAFDDDHIHERQQVSWLGYSKTKYGRYSIDSRTLVYEGWNRNRTSGPQRPVIKCQRGLWYRTYTVHRVRAADVWEFSNGMQYHGAVKQRNFTKRSSPIKC